jgi:hypothetical protein
MKLSLRLSYSNHFLVSTVFFLLLAITSVYSQTNLGFKKTQKETVEINELEVFADRFFKERNMDANNALVVLVKDKKTFFKTYPEHSQSFSELTRFNSKAFDEIFTALSLLQLQEAEKINLRGDIANYKWKYDRNFKQNILIENLLTHTTGIQENIIYSNPERKREPDFNKNTSLVRFGEPNEFISYTADDLVILHTILQDSAGKSSDEYIRESILAKLNLENSVFENAELLVTGKDLEKIIPIFLNAEDLALKGILKKETWNEIFQEKLRMEDKLPGTVIGFFEHYENNIWGYSRVNESNDHTEKFVFFPDKNSAIYLYTNSYNPILRREIVSEFLDSFFPVEKKKVKRDKSPGYDEYLQNFEGEYASVQISKHTISKFRTYNTSIRIKKENKMLILESDKMDPYGDLEGRLEFIEIDPFLFRCLDREAYISFKMNEAGNVEYLLSGSGQHGAYRKLPLFETKTFHENLGIFFLSFYSIMLLLLVVEFPYAFAKKIAYVPNRMRRNVHILLWLETILALILFGSFYFFVDHYRLIDTHDYILQLTPYDYTIFSLPFAFILGISAFTYYALKSFIERGLHLYRQIQSVLFLLVSFAFIYWMSFWNLLSFGF